MPTIRRLHYEHLRQPFRWSVIPWFRRFSSSRACCQWNRRVTFPRTICEIFLVMDKKNRVFMPNTSICSVNDPECTHIGEDSSGERHCFVEVQIPNATEIHCLPRITFSFNLQGSSWTVNRRQFPLRAAYAMTFNGSQDLTVQRAVIDLRNDLFDGQLYTILSRVRNRNDISYSLRITKTEIPQT